MKTKEQMIRKVLIVVLVTNFSFLLTKDTCRAQTLDENQILDIIIDFHPSITISSAPYFNKFSDPEDTFESIKVFVYGEIESDSIDTNWIRNLNRNWIEKLSFENFTQQFEAPNSWNEEFEWSIENVSEFFRIAFPFYSLDRKLAIVYSRNVSDCGWYSVILLEKEVEDWKYVTSANLIPDLQLPKESCN